MLQNINITVAIFIHEITKSVMILGNLMFDVELDIHIASTIVTNKFYY